MSSLSLDSLSRTRSPEPKPRRFPAWTIPLGILLGFLLVFLLLFRDRLLPARKVEVARVIAIEHVGQEQTSPQPNNPTVAFQATGWIEPAPYPVKATALVDGVIEKVHFRDGQKVQQGDLLATLITEDFNLAVAAAKQELHRRETARDAHCAGITRTIEEMKGVQAQVESAIAVRKAAKDRLERLERSGNRAVSERDIVDAALDYERVSALVTSAESKVQQIAANLNELAFETVSMEHMI
ncbi:MAG: biotin/lipoyl-binding protein, partial [Verrucomicrobiales bacterium]